MDAPARDSWLGRKARELFGLDLRSMALFRVGLGVMLLMDLLKRSLAFTAHYTGEGIVPKEQIEDYLHVQPIFRLYMLSDEAWFQAGLFVSQALLALAFTVGYRTRLVAILSFWMLVSLQRRNPFICHTGDGLLSVLALWAIFLPLGAAYSVDQLRRPRKPELQRQHLSVATFGFCFQLVCFYFMAGWFKAQQDVWLRGDAVMEFTRIDNYVTWFGSLLADMPQVSRFFNHYTLVLEEYGSILLFVPFLTPWLRLLGIFLFVTFHIGLHLAVYIGILELSSIVFVCALLPAEFWDVLLPRVPVPRTWRRAWSGLAQRLRSSARAPQPGPVSPALRYARVGGSVLAGLLTVAVGYFNHESRDQDVGIGELPLTVTRFVRATHIAQHWIIFTDLNERPNGWFLVLAEREDGEIVDVLEETVFEQLERPERPAAFFPNHNMRRLWHLAALPRFKGLRPLLGDWLCRDWNARHDQRIQRVSVFMLEDVGEPGSMPPMLPVVDWTADSADGSRAAWRPFVQEVGRRIRSSPRDAAL